MKEGIANDYIRRYEITLEAVEDLRRHVIEQMNELEDGKLTKYRECLETLEIVCNRHHTTLRSLRDHRVTD